tara:strand:+ start:1349 stop:1522 length:174 start_codon:yes stop_codon:yes gene_type:complete
MTTRKKLFDFCAIQLEILKDREERLRKEILNCKIQKEFLEGMLKEIKKDNDDNEHSI